MTASAPPSRTPITVIAVTAIVMLLAIILIVWLLFRDEPPAGQPSPSVSASATETGAASQTPPGETPVASEVPTGGWTLHDLPGGPARGAAWIGDRWVALDGLEAWTSADGAAWDPATVDDTPQEAEGQITMGPVAILGGRAYSVGMWYGPIDAVHPVVWSTEDGSEWTQVAPSAPWGYVANDVASDGSLLAVAGGYFGFGDGRVWTSPDGATWTEHAADGGPATMNAIYGDEDGFVSVGFRVDTEGRNVPAIWHSTAGQSWTDAAVPPSDVSVTLLDVSRHPDGRYVALAIRGTEVDAGEFVTWYADDPASWTDAGVIAGGSVPGLLLATDAGVLCITGALEGPSLRTTDDAVTWTEETGFVHPEVVTRATAAATDGTTILILGGTDEADAHFAWLGRAD